MAKMPWMKFYVDDWLKDTAFMPLELQGFWMRLLCHMHTCVRRGYLLQANGQPFTLEQTALATGCSTEQAAHLRQCLISSGVASATETGILFNRRMVREADISEKRTAAGRKGGEARLLKQKSILPKQNSSKHPSKHPSKPLASSISSSESEEEEILGVGGCRGGEDFAQAKFKQNCADSPPDPLEPSWLAREWLFYLRRAVTKHDEIAGMADSYAELIRQGVSPEAIHRDILDKDRDHTEAPWDQRKRLLKNREPPKKTTAEYYAKAKADQEKLHKRLDNL